MELTLDQLLTEYPERFSSGDRASNLPEGVDTDTPGKVVREQNADKDWDGWLQHDVVRPIRPGWHDTCLRLEEMLGHQGRWRRMPHEARTLALHMAYGTADFPLAFGDIIDRRLQARYQSQGRVLDPIFEMGTSRDFKTANVFRMQGTVKRLQQVGELGAYGEAARYETRWQVTLTKYGKTFVLSWEAFKDDDLGIFDGVPADMADSAINTESWLQTTTFWDANGPLDAYFADANEGQGGVAATAFSTANLAAARSELRTTTANMRNFQGEPILKRPRFIINNATIETTVRQTLESTNVEWTESAGGAATERGTKNIAAVLGLTHITDDWLDVVCTTGTIADTTWALFCENIKGAVMRRLQGVEAPELFMRSPNAVRVGGGAVSPFDGSFDDDSMAWKVRHCVGRVATDMRAGWASDGQ